MDVASGPAVPTTNLQDRGAMALISVLRGATVGPRAGWPGVAATGDAAFDDDDSWLNMSMQELDAMLATRLGQQARAQAGSSSSGADVAQQGLDKIVGSMSGFLGNVSTHEGAEVDSSGANELDELSDSEDELESGSEDDEHTASTLGGLGSISFDPAAFVKTLRELAGDLPLSDATNTKTVPPAHPASDGSSSERSTPKSNSAAEVRSQSQQPEGDMGFADIAAMMDEELQGTTLTESFSRPEGGMENAGSESSTNGQRQASTDKSDEAVPGAAPLDLDFNMVDNLLQSYSAQQVRRQS